MIVQCRGVCEVLSVFPDVISFWSGKIEVTLKDCQILDEFWKKVLYGMLLNNKIWIRKFSNFLYFWDFYTKFYFILKVNVISQEFIEFLE